ncbi:cell division cycle protein 27 homolog [Styela clava]|uniref:cell division cycle protein 27 homolog n=1 Tax=Styela clava TaxID=7725 RepID=UPI001939B1A5|nr:cell division cycle protein 27 homolog [Styela clava]
MTIIQEPIKAAIWHSLNHYAFADAIFLAERLFAEVASSDSLFLLATAYYRSGKPKITQMLLDKHGMTMPECKLLYAQCAWELEEYAKVEQIFGLNFSPRQLNGSQYITNIINDIHSEFGESSCFALSLLGRTYLRTERPDLAEHCLLASLKQNPFLWVPFEKMCQAGKRPNPNEIFNVDNFIAFRSQFPVFQTSGINSQQQRVSQPRRKSLSKDLELENNAPDPTSILRSKQLQNRNYLSEQQQTAPVPMSVTPSSVFSMKSGFPTAVGKSQTPIHSTKLAPTSHLHAEHMVTPPPTRVDFAGIISTSGSLKPLPSSTTSQKDQTIATPGGEFFRSTPAGDHRSDWDSSIDSITSGISNQTLRRSTRTQQRIGRGLISGPTTLSPLTPSFGILPLADTPSPVLDRGVSMVTPADIIQQQEFAAPLKKMITRQSRKPHSTDQSSNNAAGKLNFTSENTPRLTSHNNTNTSNQSSTPSNQQSMPVRRSTRIFANAGNSIKENNRNAGKQKFNQPKASMKRNTRTRQSTTKSARDLSEEISKADILSHEKQNLQNIAGNINNQSQMLSSQRCAVEGLMTLLRDIGHGYLALCQYKCKDAINIFNSLSPHQRNTGWVLSALGRAHFELTEYNEAANIFQELRTIVPHHLQGLEIYSTTLWHLQKEVELSRLARDMKELDKLCSETWCAIGNCFSLQRDHSSAVNFFHRAIQLDAQSSYAYTLLGHEMGLIEDLDGALTCYRNAVKWNPRHYNAWYGIGTIYYKQEKFKIAEIHFRKAFAINPQNSVLLCHIGIVQHALKQTTSAIRTLDTAVEMEPRNPLCKFHRANVLFAAERYEDAARELKELKEMVPKESLVHFLLGKVYKKLKQNHLAVISFSWAMDLDPKGANNQIKEAIDKQHLPDDEEDDMSEREDTATDGSVLEPSLLEHSPTDMNANSDIFGRGGLFQETTIRNDFQDRRRNHDNAAAHQDSDSESL